MAESSHLKVDLMLESCQNTFGIKFVEEGDQARKFYLSHIIWYYHRIRCFMKVKFSYYKCLSFLNVKFYFILATLVEIFNVFSF